MRTRPTPGRSAANSAGLCFRSASRAVARLAYGGAPALSCSAREGGSNSSITPWFQPRRLRRRPAWSAGSGASLSRRGRPSGLGLVQSRGERDWTFLRAQTRDWPLHWFWLEMDGLSLTIESSRHRTVPLYLTATDGCARAEWDPRRLLPFVRPKLDWDAAAYFLATFEQPYSSSTLLADLFHLPAGYLARIRPDQPGEAWRFIPGVGLLRLRAP